MPANTQIVASLGWTDAPPDLACIPGDLNQLGRVMAQFFNVNSVTSELDTGSQNSIAQQALEQSAIALATAQQALSSAAQIRSSGEPISLAPGDTSLNISFAAMPDANYMVIGTFYGDDLTLGTNKPTFRVVTGTRTITSCRLAFEDIPTGKNFAFAYLIRSLTQ
tara:strand:- start:303 stop:797 length:495 start_codon:yes stop_codon:yes gene_type:complete